MYDNSENRIHNASSLGINKKWFDIFAVSVCERFIGTAGGGNFYPSLMQKPSLTIHMSPDWLAAPYSLILYKTMVVSGNNIDIISLLNARDHSIDIKYIDNTSGEILKSIKEFVSIPVLDWKRYIEEEHSFPIYTLGYEAPARLSKVDKLKVFRLKNK